MKIKKTIQTMFFLLSFFCCVCLAVVPVNASKFTENFNDSVEIDKTVEIIPVVGRSLEMIPVSLFPKSSNLFGDFGKEEECEGDFGCPCNRTNPCNQARNLECVDDMCICMNSMHRYYDQNLEECVILIDAPCSVNSGPRCPSNAKCFLKSCRCNLRFSVANESSVCLLNAYEPCRAHQCNYEKGLACKNNVCTCMDSLNIYSALASRCISPDQTIKKFARTAQTAVVKEVADGAVREAVNIGIHFLSLPWKMFTAFG